MADPQTSQFQLLFKRRLGPLFFTQFLGAFNDNLYKAALTLLLVYAGLVAEEVTDVVVNLAAALFIVPFFLFSATAGTLADRYEKSRLIRVIKGVEVGVAVLIAGALYLQSVVALLFVLFLLGLQSTFFGPLKFSILPQHLHQTELIGGNAMVAMGTFVSILLGTIVGGVIGAQQTVTLGLSFLVIGVAVLGLVSSWFIPVAPSSATDKEDWNPFRQTAALMRIARERKSVFLSILGVSWFWLLGSVYLTQIPNLTRGHLMGNESVVTTILAVFTISIALGSVTCEWLSNRRIEIGLVPMGAFGITVFGIDAYFAMSAIETAVADADGLRNGFAFLAGDGTARLVADLALLGFCGGLFIVPLQAMIQSRTPEDRRARVIAANNIMNALFMVLGAAIAIVWLAVLGRTIPSMLLLMAIVNGVVALFIFNQVPEFAMRFVIWLLGHSMYRVSHAGLDLIPERGAAVIVCNHVSFVDALLLAGAVRRPIRFIMFKPIYDIPVLNFVFRTGRAIPIAAQHDDIDAYTSAFEEIAEGLDQGDLLCVFPEGKLTADGEIDDFKAGIEKIVGRNPVPVIPMALKGLWGSFFSRAGRGAFRTPNRFWSRVEVVAGRPIQPAMATAPALREAVMSLRGDAR